MVLLPFHDGSTSVYSTGTCTVVHVQVESIKMKDDFYSIFCCFVEILYRVFLTHSVHCIHALIKIIRLKLENKFVKKMYPKIKNIPFHSYTSQQNYTLCVVEIAFTAAQLYRHICDITSFCVPYLIVRFKNKVTFFGEIFNLISIFISQR